MAPAVSKPSGLKDDTYLKAYSTLKTVVENDTTLKEKVSIPVMVITGMQSAGKTTLIEAIVGFPLGYTDRLTGTRCPVRYIMRNAEEFSWKVAGTALGKCEDVREKVTEHMKTLAKQNKFAHKALIVEICGSDMSDIDITDLPGLQDPKEKTAVDIADIAAKFFADPNVIPVAVCKAEKSQQTQMDISALERIGFNVKKGLVVVNYFNKQIGDLHTASDLNDYCNGYLKKFRKVYFLMLHYKDGINKDGMSFQQATEFYSRLEEDERRTFEEKITELERSQPGEKVQENVKKCLGVKSVVEAMQRILSDWMEGHRQKIVKILTEKGNALSERIGSLKQCLQEQEPDKLVAVWDDYISEWHKVMNGVYQAKLCQHHVKSQPNKTTIFAKSVDRAFDPYDAALVRTFDEEFDLLPAELKRKVDFFPDSKELREQLKGTHLGDLLDARLSPHASFHRLLMVCAYVIMIYPLRPLTLDEVYSKNGYSSDGMAGRFNKHAVVKDMITERLFEIQDIMEVTLYHIQIVYEAPVQRVHQLLAERHPVVREHHGFQKEMNDLYRKELEEQLLQANRWLQDLIKMKASGVSVDMIGRMIALLGLLPLRQDILKTSADIYENELDGKDEDSKREMDEGEFQGRGSRSSQPWLSSNNVIERTPNYDVPERVKMHRRALLETKKALRKVKEEEEFNFMYIDFVEGGCSDLFPEERRCIDVDELNKEAEQYFVLLKGLIAFDIECALNHHVYAFLSGQLLDGMEQKMRTKIHEIAFKDGGSKISQMVGGQETLKKHIAEYKEELQSVEETLKQLDATGELEPAPKSHSSPAPMGGRDMALQSRRDVRLVKGVVEFQCMDLTKVKKAWASQFCQCAEEDIASCIGLERRKVKAIIEDSGLKYELESQTPEQGKKMIEKLEDNIDFKKCAKIYCKCLNLPSTCEAKFAATKSSKQTLNSQTSAKDFFDDAPQEVSVAAELRMDDSDDATQGQNQRGARVVIDDLDDATQGQNRARVVIDELNEWYQDEGRAAAPQFQGKVKDTDGEAPVGAPLRDSDKRKGA